VKTLNRFLSRAAGLAVRARLPDGQGVALHPCRAVHTLGMRYPLDIVFLDRGDRIVRTVTGLRPWRAVDGGYGAITTVEWPSGRMDPARWGPGTQVQWREAVMD
jgi:hypothetical protein